MVLLELLSIVHVFVGINSISEQQSKLFISMTDSEIIQNQFNLYLMMTCTLALILSDHANESGIKLFPQLSEETDVHCNHSGCES